jgi:hypothetical protein
MNAGNICRKLSLSELSAIQKKHSQVYLRAAASDNGNPFASLSLSPSNTTYNTVKSNPTPSERFVHLQLPIPLWRELLAAFGDQHVSNINHHRRHHHVLTNLHQFIPYI